MEASCMQMCWSVFFALVCHMFASHVQASAAESEVWAQQVRMPSLRSCHRVVASTSLSSCHHPSQAKHRDPKDHINMRILHFGSKVQDRGFTLCRILVCMWPVGPLKQHGTRAQLKIRSGQVEGALFRAEARTARFDGCCWLPGLAIGPWSSILRSRLRSIKGPLRVQ